ncbi:MAG: N-acyl homoserine lactonase family protein [Alphaproteobacteria bacterium]|nr:N-acyl homoserine lactonase family protein [Alphaproteobacteria bacterium]
MTILTSLPQINSPDDIYQIYSLCYARAPSRRVHENFMTRDMHDGPMPLDFNIWIIKNNARTLIVDTGFDKRAAGERGFPLDIDPILGLEKIGIHPDQIDDVILTHLHFDHAGNLDRFGRSQFHVQDKEVTFATGRCMCEAHLRRPFDVEDVITFVRHTYNERVCFHDGDINLMPGISLHPLPGHSMGLQGVLVNTQRGHVLLASDASHLYANFMRRAPYALTIDAMATLRTYQRMIELAGDAAHIIPGHDPLVRQLYPELTLNGVTVHALHEVPKPHDLAKLTAL